MEGSRPSVPLTPLFLWWMEKSEQQIEWILQGFGQLRSGNPYTPREAVSLLSPSTGRELQKLVTPTSFSLTPRALGASPQCTPLERLGLVAGGNPVY